MTPARHLPTSGRPRLYVVHRYQQARLTLPPEPQTEPALPWWGEALLLALACWGFALAWPWLRTWL